MRAIPVKRIFCLNVFTAARVAGPGVRRVPGRRMLLRKYLADTALFLNKAIAKKKKVLAEGPRGRTDVDHGTLPLRDFIKPDGRWRLHRARHRAAVHYGGDRYRQGLHHPCGRWTVPHSRSMKLARCCAHAERNMAQQPAGREDAAGRHTGHPPRRTRERDDSMALTKLDVLDTLDEIKICVDINTTASFMRKCPASFPYSKSAYRSTSPCQDGNNPPPGSRSMTLAPQGQNLCGKALQALWSKSVVII